MAKATLEGNSTRIQLNNDISYLFSPRSADILSVKIDGDDFEPNRIVDILNATAGLLWRRETTINTYKRASEGWEDAYKKRNAAYRSLKRTVIILGAITFLVGFAFLIGV